MLKLIQGEQNFRRWLRLIDEHDREEGKQAYKRYRYVLAELMWHLWGSRDHADFETVVAAFVTLSPNNDYVGNLRSLASVMVGVKEGLPMHQVQVSTYRHRLHAAWSFATREADFLDVVKGPKVRAFYTNILDPAGREHVTIDGHMKAMWLDQDLTMKEALVKSMTEYHQISTVAKALACEANLIPCALQAALWFTRKRVLGIKYNPQTDLFADPTDMNRTLLDPTQIKPYPRPSAKALVLPAVPTTQLDLALGAQRA